MQVAPKSTPRKHSIVDNFRIERRNNYHALGYGLIMSPYP